MRETEVIDIPTLSDSDEDCEALFAIARRVHSLRNRSIVFDFSNCRSLMQNAIAVLGGLAKLAEHFNNRVDFSWHTLNPKTYRTLKMSGLMAFRGRETIWKSRTAVPFRHDEALAEDDLVQYLHTWWIGRGWVHLSDQLKDAIIGKVLEIYLNAFHHGHSPVGVFTAGHYYSRKKELKLCTVDFGVGIPDNVRALGFKDWKRTGADAMQWAFQRGNSTRPDRKNLARGLGLDLLRDFVKINKGELKIFSHDGQAVVNQVHNFTTRSVVFPGTLVNITFSCDQLFYRLASEIPDKPLF